MEQEIWREASSSSLSFSDFAKLGILPSKMSLKVPESSRVCPDCGFCEWKCVLLEFHPLDRRQFGGHGKAHTLQNLMIQAFIRHMPITI